MTDSRKIPFLVVSSSAYMRGILKFVLETLLHTEVVELESEEKALSFLKNLEYAPSMIVYDYISNAYLLEDFVGYLKENSKDVRIVILLNEVRQEGRDMLRQIPQVTLMNESNLPNGLVDEAIKTFEGSPFVNQSPYCRIDVNFLSILDGINKNLYIKIGHDKYVKLFNAEDTTDMLDINKYRAKGIHYLYLTRETALWVISQIQHQIDIFLKSNNFRFILRGSNESPEKRFEQKILRINDEVHVEKEFKETIEQTIDRIRSTVEKHPDVNDFLKNLKRNQARYAFFTQKMNICSLIACALAKQMQWISKSTLDKLVYAAVISDITLAVRPELISISGFAEFEKMKEGIPEEDAKIYLSHPQDSAFLLKKYFTLAPPDTDILVFQQHEQPDGSGFPQKLKAEKISPLSALFIVATDFSYYFIEDEDPSIEDFVLKNATRYDFVNFRKVFKALEKIKRI